MRDAVAKLSIEKIVEKLEWWAAEGYLTSFEEDCVDVVVIAYRQKGGLNSAEDRMAREIFEQTEYGDVE
jgi:hypothetical protein